MQFTSEAEAVLAMCPTVTVDEMKGHLTTGQYSMDGKTMYYHIFVPNPLAGLLQGFSLSNQPAWHELADGNIDLITKLQGKVQTGIVRGKNNCYYLRPTDGVVRSRFEGETPSHYKFVESRATPEFLNYSGTLKPTRANMSLFSRALSIWDKLGFPRQGDWRGGIFYFTNNSDSQTTDFCMSLPKYQGEHTLENPLEEVRRQLVLYQSSSKDPINTSSLKSIVFRKTGDYGRLLAQGDDFYALHVTSIGIDRANTDKMTIVMKELSEDERDWLKKLVTHTDPAFPDLIAESVLYYGTPPKPLPWLPSGIKAVDPMSTRDTHLYSIHVNYPKNTRLQEDLFSDPDGFALLGKLDRGRFWEGGSGFANSIYSGLGSYLLRLGIYDEVKERAVDPVLEAIKSSLAGESAMK